MMIHTRFWSDCVDLDGSENFDYILKSKSRIEKATSDLESTRRNWNYVLTMWNELLFAFCAFWCFLVSREKACYFSRDYFLNGRYSKNRIY